MDGYDYYQQSYNNSSYFSHDDQYHENEHRFLAPDGLRVPTVDYAVISVVVITLALVLFIEVMRHQLDVAASGNPFFQHVLELMYRELTTLGIVEFVIYLMHKYHQSFNFQAEAIFVDVHFMLFYTALFNAMQSCLVRLWTVHRVDKAWIKTEDIDLGHYVAIRKEFDRLESKLNREKSSTAGSTNNNSNATTTGTGESSTWELFREALSDLSFRIRHPHYSRRKEQLLVPIRFHELRAHFIDSNNLPPKFKVSHYLKRSLTSVLLDFVHISSGAWILLMATANFLYFISGMIMNALKEAVLVEEFLLGIFFALMIFFVVFAFVLYFKMKSIFSKILYMKLTDINDTEEEEHTKTWRGFTVLNSRNSSNNKSKSVDQVKLFWWNNPHLIIEATQYMQFGYALGLAMVFTYYKDFLENWNVVNPNILLLGLVVSYIIFLFLMSVIIPWYTLCTSMGQLVNKQRLHETLAKLKLSEEIRNKESLEEERKAEEELARRKREIKAKIEAKNAEAATKSANSSSNVSRFAKSLPISMQGSHDSLDVTKSPRMSIFRNSKVDSRPIDSLVQSEGGKGRWLKHSRKKSLSDGVQFMMPNIVSSVHGDSGSTSPTSANSRLSAAAAEQLGAVDEAQDVADESQNNPSAPTKRRNRKSISDSVALMRAMNQPSGSFEHGTESQSQQQSKPVPLSNEVSMDKSKPRSNSLEEPPNVKSASNFNDFKSFISMAPAETASNPSDSSWGQHDTKIHPEKSLGKENGSTMLSTKVASSGSLTRLCEESELSPQRLSKNLDHFDVKQGERPRRRSVQGKPDKIQRRHRRKKSHSEGVALMRSSYLPKDLMHSSDNTNMPSTKTDSSCSLTRLCELSQISTQNLPVFGSPKRGSPTRGQSESVLNSPSRSSPSRGLSETSSGKDERKQRRRRMKAQSEGVAFMRSTLAPEPTRLSFDTTEKKESVKLATLSELTQLTAKDLPEIPEYKPTSRRTFMAKAASEGVAAGRRHHLGKSASEGVAAMRAGLMGIPIDVTVNKKELPSPKNQGSEPTLKTSTNQDSPKTVSFANVKAPSIESVVSDDGYQSDIDDVPEAMLLDSMASTKRSRLRNFDLATFLGGKRYRTMSLLFGPMLCFFFIAIRVEVFNIYAGLFIDQTNIWYNKNYDLLTPSFWVEVGLYCAMMIEMIAVTAVYFKKRDRAESLIQIVAATFGFLMSLMCLLLLLISEVKRCCPNPSSSYEEESSAYGETDMYTCSVEEVPWKDRMLASYSGKDYGDDSPVVDKPIYCCPKFGTRKCGGLGIIEPFTCLIALYPLRFIVAGYILKLFGRESHEDLNSDKDSHGQHHGVDPTNKVRELWLTAIGVHSTIAKRFGLFSTEILECMLGIYNNESDDTLKELAESTSPEGSSNGNIDESEENESSKHLTRENSMVMSESSSNGFPSPSSRPTIPPKLHKRYESDDFGISFDDFAYPKSRLIRRMRRCERRILPLLDEWMLVDVVITNHELIIFEVDKTDSTELLPECTATNGGKGLYVSDVARGRQISSTFNVEDIDFVDIEHRAAIIFSEDEEVEDVEAKRNFNLLESWQGGSCNDYEVDAMNKRWGKVDEDRLKIHFKYNTLYLRFMTDLNEMESKKEALLDDPDLMHHVGTQTKIWCRTIARLRGATNLKQELPHFGNDGTDEIEDFIEMCERDEVNQMRIRRPKGLTRSASMLDMLDLSSNDRSPGLRQSMSRLDLSSSINDRRPRRHKRMTSWVLGGPKEKREGEGERGALEPST